jgi:hypothetical protein
MQSHLKKYSTGGLPIAYEIKDWLLAQDEIRNNILTTTHEPKKQAPKRRAKIGGNIVKVALIRQINAEKDAASKAKKSATSSAKRAGKTAPRGSKRQSRGRAEDLLVAESHAPTRIPFVNMPFALPEPTLSTVPCMPHAVPFSLHVPPCASSFPLPCPPQDSAFLTAHEPADASFVEFL